MSSGLAQFGGSIFDGLLVMLCQQATAVAKVPLLLVFFLPALRKERRLSRWPLGTACGRRRSGFCSPN